MKFITDRNFTWNCPECNGDLRFTDDITDEEYHNVYIHCDNCDLSLIHVYEFKHIEYTILEEGDEEYEK
jgi:hypothetical protein